MDKLLIALCVVRKIACDAVTVPTVAYQRFIRSIVGELLSYLFRPLEAGQSEADRRPVGPLESALVAGVAPPVVWLGAAALVTGAFALWMSDVRTLPPVDASIAVWLACVAFLVFFYMVMTVFGLFMMPIAFSAAIALGFGADALRRRCGAFVRKVARRDEKSAGEFSLGRLMGGVVGSVVSVHADVRGHVAKIAADFYRPVADVKEGEERPAPSRLELAVVAFGALISTALCAVVVILGVVFVIAAIGGGAGVLIGISGGLMIALFGCVASLNFVPVALMVLVASALGIASVGRAFARYVHSVADQCAAGLAR